MNHKFYGGVHPAEHKEATERKPIVPLSKAPAQVVIPMNMHLGAPCKPIVNVGDEVTVGQQIGEIAGLGSPIHASVSGKVVAVEPRPAATGDKVMSVVIENDYQDTLCSDCKPRSNIEALTPKELVEIIKAAGITGMGGAGFPTHVKISSAIGKADTLILNGAECEPYITADHRLMLEQGERVIGGARILMQALGLPKATIGVEGNKLDAIEHLKTLLPPGETGVVIETLRTRYPQGAEKQLIQRVTGREVPPGGLPADVGCCVFNVGTAAAVYDAVALGLPVTKRVVTVTGSAVARPLNVTVPLGTPFSYLIEEAGGFASDPARVISGGPHDGRCPERPVGHHRQGHQLGAVLHRRRPARPGPRAGLPALRPLRQRVPHAPDPRLHAYVRRQAPMARGGGSARHGLHRVRLLPVYLPRPHPAGPVLPHVQV